MIRRGSVSLGIVLGLAVMAGAARAQAGQEGAGTVSEGLRTPWGAPDLQGVWDYKTMTPLERPRELAGKATLTEEEAAAYEQAQNARRADYDLSPSVHAKWWLDYGTELTEDNRTALITSPADGRIPATTEDARARSQARAEARRATLSVEARGLTERCITFGVASLPRGYNNHVQILQTPDTVALVSEMIHDTRVVPIDRGEPLPEALRQWHGRPRGRWDGDTLVVETTHFSERTAFRGASASLRLIERFTRVDAATVQYEITFEDPQTWSGPWTAMVPLTRTDQPMWEYACHEGNRGLYNILHNARFLEREAERSGGQ